MEVKNINKNNCDICKNIYCLFYDVDEGRYEIKTGWIIQIISRVVEREYPEPKEGTVLIDIAVNIKKDLLLHMRLSVPFLVYVSNDGEQVPIITEAEYMFSMDKNLLLSLQNILNK